MRTTEILCPEMSKTYLQELYTHDVKHPLNQKFDAIEDFRGMVPFRPKTDSRMILLVLAILCIVITTFTLSFRRFNLRQIYNLQDFRADHCGEYQLAQKTYAYWPDPVTWGTNVRVCLEECPSEDNQEVCLYDEFNETNYEDYCFLTRKSFVT